MLRRQAHPGQWNSGSRPDIARHAAGKGRFGGKPRGKPTEIADTFDSANGPRHCRSGCGAPGEEIERGGRRRGLAGAGSGRSQRGGGFRALAGRFACGSCLCADTDRINTHQPYRPALGSRSTT